MCWSKMFSKVLMTEKLQQLSISGIHLLPDEEDSFYVSNRLKVNIYASTRKCNVVRFSLWTHFFFPAYILLPE